MKIKWDDADNALSTTLARHIVLSTNWLLSKDMVTFYRYNQKIFGQTTGILRSANGESLLFLI